MEQTVANQTYLAHDFFRALLRRSAPCPSIPAACVDIIIPVFNQLDYIRRCLESLSQTINRPANILVINNGSTDGTTEFLLAHPELTVIHNGQNRGCAAAWNQGVTAATGDWLVVLNNDVILADGWLDGLFSAATEHELDIVSPSLREGPLNYDLPSYAREFVQSLGHNLRSDTAHGICFLVRRRVFDVIGLFDENFQVGQFEDADFFARARLAGFKLGTTGRSFIHHFGSMTQNSIRLNQTAVPYEARNRAYYRKKWRMTWCRRLLDRLKEQARLGCWRVQEFLQSGHTMHERWLNGRLDYD